MKIVGAVLEETGHRGPYAVSSPLRLRELDLDPPSAHEVLVRMEVAGLCHSDLSVIDGNRPRPLPMLLGHEAAGIVEECGELVAGIDPGDRVVMTFLPRCGECPHALPAVGVPASRVRRRMVEENCSRVVAVCTATG